MLRLRVNVAELESPTVVKHCVLCQGSVVCFFPSVLQRATLGHCVRGERGEWRLWDPLHSWEETSPHWEHWGRIRRVQQDGGLQALSLVHCLQVAPGSLATRFDCWGLHAQRRKHKGACIPQLMYNIMARCGNKDGWGCEVPFDFRNEYCCFQGEDI